MFREILGMGLAVVVAESDRATLAARRIRSPEAAAEFLAALVSAATGT
jgi:hypothetical protein